MCAPRACSFPASCRIQVFSASVETQFGGFLLCCFVIWVQCFGACWARHFIVACLELS